MTKREKLDKIKEKVYSRKRNSRSFVAKGLLSLRRRLRVFLKSLPLRGERNLVMKTFFKQFHGQTLATVVTFFAAALIAACGGGGGSSGTIVTPATGTVTKATSCTIQANAASCGASVEYTTSGASSPKLVVGTTTMATQASGTVPVTVGNVTVPVTLYDNATVLDSSKSITGSCTSGTSWNGNACAPVVTAWWPPTFVPMGTKVYLDSTKAPAGAVVNATYPGQTQSGLLPPECKTTGDACWQEAVRNGTIKFIATSQVETDSPTRSIVFGFYKTVSTIVSPGKTVYCNKPFFADNGTHGVSDAVENRCILAEEVSFVGNTLGGIVVSIENGLTVCYQKKFDSNLLGWLNTQVVCQ